MKILPFRKQKRVCKGQRQIVLPIRSCICRIETCSAGTEHKRCVRARAGFGRNRPYDVPFLLNVPFQWRCGAVEVR